MASAVSYIDHETDDDCDDHRVLRLAFSKSCILEKRTAVVWALVKLLKALDTLVLQQPLTLRLIAGKIEGNTLHIRSAD